MRNVRFYVEYKTAADKRKATRRNLGNHTGNCIAVLTDVETSNPRFVATIAGVFEDANSPCCFTEAQREYIRETCLFVSEETARSIHPNLFFRLGLT